MEAVAVTEGDTTTNAFSVVTGAVYTVQQWIHIQLEKKPWKWDEEKNSKGSTNLYLKIIHTHRI